MAQFIYQFRPGDRPELATRPDSWTDQDEDVASRHFSYLEDGVSSGIVILAGRSQDGIGPAIVIIERDSEESARSFMENDPFVAGGLFRASLHPYRVALMRG